MTNQATIDRLIQIVYDITETTVTPDELLMESGLVNSLTSVDIVMAVQKEFGCKIPPTEIDEHLESVNTLATFIQAHQTA